MIGKVSFRIIDDGDKKYLQDLYADSREWEFAYSIWKPEEKTKFLNSQFELQSVSYQMSYLTAVHRIIQLDGVDIGRLILNRADDHMHIIDFTVHSQYQGRGIGSDILSALQNEAQGGKVPITLNVIENNPALNLYLRKGFKKTGMNGHHIEMKWSPDLGPRHI
ncbi:MAG: GNAT family N-acetyltransferase [Hellea sp.]